ncbi:hypothetical protein SRABI118_02618 [Massilia sp. Bi118]|uniref:DUF6851 domain-containing protein n=1 Tax=Massilia sp. Bi118 TaxID=2822346 RepID=UPI001DC6A1B6|nr:hypothetical protein [Massilia sp. Bi118]CAH0237168.1 hypothetical protein SRABI118_02618 [Massilia sp. Bi118]
MRRENFLKLESEGADAAAGMAGTVLGWNRLALQAVRKAQPGPAPAARTLAALHTCMYNAWAAYDDTARQTAHGVAVRLPAAERRADSRAAAMSHAAWRVLGDLFPAQQAAFDARMASLGLDPAAGGGPLSPAGIGRGQAAAMRAFCRHEGAGRPGGLVGNAGLASPQAMPPVIEPAPGRWFLPAHLLSEHDGYSDDQDVRLFFALANALAEAGTLAIQGSLGAATSEVIRRFKCEKRGDTRFELAGSAGEELGRKAGARAFEGARRYWEGKL